MSDPRLSRSLEEGFTYSGAAFADQLEGFIARRHDDTGFQKAVLREAHEALQKVRYAIIGRPPVEPAACLRYYRVFAGMYQRVVSTGHTREQMNYWFLLAEGFVGGLPQATEFSDWDRDLLRDLAKIFRSIADDGEMKAQARLASEDDDE